MLDYLFTFTETLDKNLPYVVVGFFSMIILFLLYRSSKNVTLSGLFNPHLRKLFLSLGKEGYIYQCKTKTNGVLILEFKSLEDMVDDAFITKNRLRILNYLALDPNARFEVMVEKLNFKIKIEHLESYQFSTQYLKHTSIFFGLTYGNEPVYIAIDDLPHILVGALSGGGKSNLLGLLLTSILYNLNGSEIERVILCDMKFGVEFRPFDNINEKIEVVSDFQTLDVVLSKLIKIMEYRAGILIKEKKRKWVGNKIIFIFDELATLKDYINMNSKNKETKLFAEEIELKYNKLLALSRFANISFISSTQRPSHESLNTTCRENHSGRLCGRMSSSEGTTCVLGSNKLLEDAGIDNKLFRPGQFAFINPTDSKTYILMTPYIPDDYINIVLNQNKGAKK
jgi:S-DNA-T family DNA segregation ATPase FtsK/SpoIIIE